MEIFLLLGHLVEEGEESIRLVKLQFKLSSSPTPILCLISEELRLPLNPERRQMLVGSTPWDCFFEFQFSRTHTPFSQARNEKEEVRGAGSEILEKVTILGKSDLADGTGWGNGTP